MMVLLQCLSVSLLLGLALGQSAWIDYIPGDIPIIISSPHGGHDEPSSIPDRDAGCYVAGRCVWDHACQDKDFDQCGATTSGDVNTQELARQLRNDLFDLFGGYPYLVVNLLHRRKLDTNREIGEGAFNVAEAEDAWNTFHDAITDAKNAAGGMGIVYDIHGHGQTPDWAMLGYLISGDDLNNNNYIPEDTSIRNLADYANTNAGTSFDELLKGATSFGGYMEAEGYRATPGPVDSGPGSNTYYSGGYITQVHGSRDGGQIDAIQIESARVHRDDYVNYSFDMSSAIYNYVTTHYPALPVNHRD